MAEQSQFPRHIVLAGAMIFGMLLALAGHILIQRFDLNVGDLWRPEMAGFIPARAAIAWWILAGLAFFGGYTTASLMSESVSGQVSRHMRRFLIVVGLLMLAAAGQAASAPTKIPSFAGVLGGVSALCLGAIMAFCGSHFALKRNYAQK